MTVRLVAFGIAKDILSHSHMDLVVDGGNIRQLKDALVREFPEFDKLKSLRFAVNEEYQPDDFVLSENDEVVIIPPVSGG